MYSAGMTPFEIEPTALALLLENKATGPFLLLDVREPWEFELGHLTGSVAMPMGEVASRANAELDPDQHIVAICHHGVRSLNVAVWLRNQGFGQAQSLQGGLDAWSRLVDPQMPRY